MHSLWDRILTGGKGHVGVMSRDELPFEELAIRGHVTLPMPESLKPLAREWGRENPATTEEE